MAQQDTNLQQLVINQLTQAEYESATINPNELYMVTDGEIKATSVVDTKTNSADRFWTGTKAEYEALATKDSNTFYNIIDDSDITLTLLETIYPVGSIYITTNNTCPLSALFGTWQLVAQDRVLQGAGTRGNVGTTLNESLPNIKGAASQIAAGTWWTQGSLVMVPKIGDNTNALTASSSTSSIQSLGFDASRSSSTYQNNAPVQQDAYLVNVYRRTA